MNGRNNGWLEIDWQKKQDARLERMREKERR